MPEIMTVKEVAAILRISDQTVIRAIKSGKLKAKKVGKQYRITSGAVHEWVEQK
jgi:excisionase family DNA binding protein